MRVVHHTTRLPKRRGLALFRERNADTVILQQTIRGDNVAAFRGGEATARLQEFARFNGDRFVMTGIGFEEKRDDIVNCFAIVHRFAADGETEIDLRIIRGRRVLHADRGFERIFGEHRVPKSFGHFDFLHGAGRGGKGHRCAFAATERVGIVLIREHRDAQKFRRDRIAARIFELRFERSHPEWRVDMKRKMDRISGERIFR